MNFGLYVAYGPKLFKYPEDYNGDSPWNSEQFLKIELKDDGEGGGTWVYWFEGKILSFDPAQMSQHLGKKFVIRGGEEDCLLGSEIYAEEHGMTIPLDYFERLFEGCAADSGDGSEDDPNDPDAPDFPVQD